MRGIGKSGYVAALTTLLVTGAVTMGGIAHAEDDDGISSHDGAPGQPGQATTHCRQKVAANLNAPIQCQENPGGEAQAGRSHRGTHGVEGRASHVNTDRADNDRRGKGSDD